MSPPFGPILVTLGPVQVHWYGVLIFTGVVLGAVYASRRAVRLGISPDHIWSALTLCIVLGIIGARLYHVFSTPAECTASTPYACGWPWYRQHPLDIFKIWNGGLGIYGAVIGGIAAVAIYTRANGLALLTFLDLGAPGLALGQFVGRWGNFINQELYGPPTGSTWFGVRIDAAHRLAIYADMQQYPADTLFHPTFLYESLWCLALFVTLAVLARKLEGRLLPGDIFAGYVIGYPLGRFWIEFFRPDAWTWGALATAQWIALIAIAIGIAFIVLQHKLRRPLGVSQASEALPPSGGAEADPPD
ncbi:MAG: prolipoprotein diacylglyceryl transferase [Anaerolineae bacterium]|nr:prolipoprotein diacylglyceryl transferase [Anaerolineae bacterium]